MNRTITLGTAMAIDASLGDPKSWPHPVSAIAAIAAFCEHRMRVPEQSPTQQRCAGVGAWTAVIGCTAVGTWGLLFVTRRISPRFSEFVESAMIASTLSLRSLLDHVEAVVDALEQSNLEEARRNLSRIVGRDTRDLDISEICRASIETLAESTCDGIVAPLMYAVLSGPTAAMSYKAINTLDSLFGHIEPPYTYFGYCAAKMDDLANFLPARLTAFAIIASSQFLNDNGKTALETFRVDRRKHRSVNAGQCEAAMAGALHVRLGGTNTYDGVPTPSPHLGANYSPPRIGDVRHAIRLVTAATALCYAAALTACIFRERNMHARR